MIKKFIRKNKRVNKLESLTYEFLNSFNFFTKYQELCQSHSFDMNLNMVNPEIDKLLEIVKRCGYPKAKKRDKRLVFFTEKINISGNNMEFCIGNLNYGICEFQMYFNSKNDEYILGDVGIRLYPLKQYVEENNFERREPYVGYPKFKSYQEFEEVFIELAILYENFKKAVVESGIQTSDDVDDIIE